MTRENQTGENWLCASLHALIATSAVLGGVLDAWPRSGLRCRADRFLDNVHDARSFPGWNYDSTGGTRTLTSSLDTTLHRIADKEGEAVLSRSTRSGEAHELAVVDDAHRGDQSGLALGGEREVAGGGEDRRHIWKAGQGGT
jgi:hypothetical protein